MTEIKHTTRSSEKILIVADDLTGAVDTGAQFRKRSYKTCVITSSDEFTKSLDICDVLVVDTESRFDDAKTAYNKTFETGKLARSENFKYIYKKLDSTMRGNVGAEIAGLMDSMEISLAFLVPALPLYGRTTLDGKVYVKGILLEETDFAKDPKNPVRESYIPSIISNQTAKSTGVITIEEIRSGRKQLTQKLETLISSDIQIIVIDAENNEDLDLIASFLSDRKERLMFAGCSGFAEALSGFITPEREKKISIVFAGSVNKVTIRQVEEAADQYNIQVVDIDAEAILSGETDKELDRIIRIAGSASMNGKDLIIRSAKSREYVDECFRKARENGIDESALSDIISGFIGILAAEIIRSVSLKGIILTGGDTAFKTMKALKIKGIVIEGEIAHGIPYGTFVDESFKDLIVVTKAGGFGGRDALIQILNFMKNA